MAKCCWAIGCLLHVFCLWIAAATSAEPIRFVDDRFVDFSEGTLDDGGHNLYVARNGSLRTINRFDLNSDGHLDVLFNCTHDTYQMLPATVGTVGADRRTHGSDLGFEGTQRAVLHDLNRDGYVDVVACPNPIGVHHDRRFVMIAWGGPNGWDSTRINTPLPMNAAVMAEVADLNHDGWPDIVVLGAHRWQPDQPEGRIIRIYWGSETGFSVTERHDLGVASAIDLSAADFDGDGARDLGVLGSDGNVTFFWSTSATDGIWAPVSTQLTLPLTGVRCFVAADVNGDATADLLIGSDGTTEATNPASASGGIITVVAGQGERRWGTPEPLEAFPATHITAEDLDNDGHIDLVLTQFDQARAAGGEQAGVGKETADSIRILWGGPEGFAKARATSLQAPGAVATAAGDLDADGHLDLAVAIHQGETTFNGESVPFFGDGQRGFAPGPSGFPTSGTLHVVIAPAEHELPARALFCNSIGGHLDESVPLHLFWGGPAGFDPQRYWKIPFHSGYEASAADLNANGFPDLIVLNSGHAGEHSHVDPTLGANILWGGPEGLENSQQRTVLHEHFLGTSSVVDLNRDGWLDLVLEAFAPEQGADKEKLIIYYGGPDGFPRSRRVEMAMDGYAQEHLVADFNRDQWLDIAVTSRSFDCVRILWGGPQGFQLGHEQRLKIAGPVGVEAADFNGDGWLDLVSGSYNDPVSGHRDMGLVIFWGGPQGYRHSDAQWLPGFSPLGRTIADLDGDGFLDLFSPQHSGELTREDLACHIYWGSPSGFATRHRTTLFGDSVNDSMAADFNGDGLIDLAVNSHTRHGDHRTQSKVFYNDGKRFTQPTIQHLPTNGPHLMWATDVGHIYHRQYQHAFTSRVLAWEAPTVSGTIRAKATLPTGTRLELAVRTAESAGALGDQSWIPVHGGEFSIPVEHRRAQYRATLVSDNGDRYPVVSRIEVELHP